MLLLLIATLLGDWRYEGFASDSAQPAQSHWAPFH